MKGVLRKVLVLFLFLFLPVSVTASAEREENLLNPYQKLEALIKTISPTLERLAIKPPFKSSSWNDSLSVTSLAAQKLVVNSPPSEIWTLLDEAREQFHDNSFAVVLQGIILDRTDKPEKANKFFKKFLLKSRIFTEFEESFVKWYQFDQLRRFVYQVLKERGVTFKKEERELRVRSPFEEFMRHLAHLPLQDQTTHVFFMILLGGGLILFLLSSLTNVILVGPFIGSIPNLYVMICAIYILWLGDLACGLPFNGSRHFAVPILLGMSLILFVISSFISLWKEKNIPLEKGFRRCPHCQAVIVALSVQCFKCHKLIES